MRMKTPWGLLCALLIIILDKGCCGQEELTTTLMTTTSTPSLSPENSTHEINQTKGENIEYGLCPTRCYCRDGFRHVDCSNASLTEIPPAIPPQVQYLSLRDNALTVIPAFPQLSDLRVLDLSGNLLETVHQELFDPLNQLQELDLHGNRLNGVTGLLNAMPGLHVLNLSRNRITDLDSLVLTRSAIKTLDAGYNQIGKLPNLLRFPNVASINLQHNQIRRLEINNELGTNHTSPNISIATSNVSVTPSVFLSISELDLSANEIHDIDDSFFTVFPNLEALDLADNAIEHVENAWGTEEEPACNHLQSLDLANNGFRHIPNDMLLGCCPNLTMINLSKQENLTHINSRSFNGLSSVQNMNLSHCPELRYIHAWAFSSMPMLTSLDLSYIQISSMHKALLPSSLTHLNLEGIKLNCSCDLSWMTDFNTTSLALKPQNLTCHTDTEEVQISEFEPMNCSAPIIITKPESLHRMYTIGASARFDCAVDGKPIPHVTWIASSSKHEFRYHPAFLDHSELMDPGKDEFHALHYWHELSKYFHDIPLAERVFVLENGSLYIDYVTRQDAGRYECVVENEHGNTSLVVTVTLNYNALIETKIWCVVIGFASAVSFLLIGILAGLIRWLATFCSREEKEKRRSIWELLVTIQEYKSEKVDVFRAYKDAKMDKLSEFKNHKIDKLRTYKQDTVTNILTHMHSMREHYQGQMAKIKDNYSDQANRLRDNYSQHITKIKDYRQEKVDHLRANYQCQALKIRDYGAAQMQRLREQYKLQQQHMLKLLELLDIGNCMSVIEAECMRTESMLFDPDIAFDFDESAVAVHVPYPTKSSKSSKSSPLALSDDSSEYVTACSVSDDNASVAGSVLSPRSAADPRRASDASCSSDSSSSDSSLNIDHSILTANLDPEIQKMLLEDTENDPKPVRKCKRKRRRHCSAQCRHAASSGDHGKSPQQKEGAGAGAENTEPSQHNQPQSMGDSRVQNDQSSSFVLVVDNGGDNGISPHLDSSDEVHAAESIV